MWCCWSGVWADRGANRFQIVFTGWLGVYFARSVSVLLHVFQPGDPLRAHQPPSMLHLAYWKWAETVGGKEGKAVLGVRKERPCGVKMRERVMDSNVYTECHHMFDDALQTYFLDWNLGDLVRVQAPRGSSWGNTGSHQIGKNQLLMENNDGRPVACWLRAVVHKTHPQWHNDIPRSCFTKLL